MFRSDLSSFGVAPKEDGYSHVPLSDAFVILSGGVETCLGK